MYADAKVNFNIGTHCKLLWQPKIEVLRSSSLQDAGARQPERFKPKFSLLSFPNAVSCFLLVVSSFPDLPTDQSVLRCRCQSLVGCHPCLWAEGCLYLSSLLGDSKSRPRGPRSRLLDWILTKVCPSILKALSIFLAWTCNATLKYRNIFIIY